MVHCERIVRTGMSWQVITFGWWLASDVAENATEHRLVDTSSGGDDEHEPDYES